jgi:twitching motility two-component system response regulator PilH
MNSVLVVDDSVVVREMISSELRHMGYDVKVAIDGVDALTQLENALPDLVIVDIVMPRMNGYELCRWIKSDPRTKNIPVIMCSTKDQEFDRYWGMKQGADAYVTKPCPVSDMIHAIQTLLANSGNRAA